MASHAPTAQRQLVTFLLGQGEYAVDVMAVREILDLTEITRVANTPPHVEGIINLRGSVIPVVSLEKRLGLAPVPADAAPYIAVLDCAGTLTGFIIDEISDVIRIDAAEILPPPEEAGQSWITGIIKKERSLVVVVDLAPLAKEC